MDDLNDGTALILIDFQKSNSGLPLQPFSYDQVIASAERAASAVRAAGGLVVRTKVLEEELLHPPVDKPLPDGTPASDGATLDPRLSQQPGDVVVTKRQWGAFYGTSLDQHLRRRGIRQLVVAGIATEVGVESTVREAYDRGYQLVFLKDAITGASVSTYDMFMSHLFPMMGRVRHSGELASMLEAGNPP